MKRFFEESLIPIIVSTAILASIFYFANSRDFYFVQSEEDIHHTKYTIIPPSDHLIQSGEDYPIHVMVRKPFNWKRDAKRPFISCLVIFSTAPYIKKRKA